MSRKINNDSNLSLNIGGKMNILILEVVDPVSKKTKFILLDKDTGLNFKGKGIKTGYWAFGNKKIKMFSMRKTAEFARTHFENLYNHLLDVHYSSCDSNELNNNMLDELPLFTSHKKSYVK